MDGKTGRWQMHIRKTPDARHNEHESPAGVQRLELLWWRFSEAEIQRLSLLQLVQRERPNALDLPLEECRLRFARWLVATGRLSEQTERRLEECRLEAQPWAREAVGDAAEVLACHGCVPAARADLLAGACAGEPPAHSAQGHRPMDGRLLLVGAWRRLRRGMARVAAFGRGLGRLGLDDPPNNGGTWGPYGPWNPYGPYGAWGPYGPSDPYGSARSVADDPWRWMRFRHDS